MAVCLTIYLTVRLPVCLSICLFVCLSVCLTIYLSICLSIRPSVCLPPAAAFHPYCQQGFGNNFRRKYTQSPVICQSVVVKFASHVCKFGLFAPVVLHVELHGCRSGLFVPVIPLFHCRVCKSWVSAPVGFNECCPELRQEPARLRVLSNLPRAMPLFGFTIIVMSALCTS